MGIKIILCTNLNEREKRGESEEKPRFSARRRCEPRLIQDYLLALRNVLVLASLSSFKP